MACNKPSISPEFSVNLTSVAAVAAPAFEASARSDTDVCRLALAVIATVQVSARVGTERGGEADGELEVGALRGDVVTVTRQRVSLEAVNLPQERAEIGETNDSLFLMCVTDVRQTSL